MKISRNSWHYRYNQYVRDDWRFRAHLETFTTCSYIRTTMFTVLVHLMQLGFIAVTIGALLAFTLLLSVPVLAISGFVFPADLLGASLAAWIGIGSLIGVLLFAFVSSQIEKAYIKAKRKRQTLLSQALQDRKDGICTIVDFED